MKATKLKVTYPEQTFAPVQYHSFRMGGISIEIDLSDEDKVSDATEKAMKALRTATDKQFEVCLVDFLRRVEAARSATK